MLSSMKVNAERWCHRCGFAVLLASVWGCASDAPFSPTASPAPSIPTTPAPRSAPPGAPAATKLILSRPDVVFNAVTGGASRDTAAVLVTSTSGDLDSDLRAVIHYGQGRPDGWLVVEQDRAALPATLTVRATTAPLAPGEYTAIVQLTTPGAAADSVTVTARVVTGIAIGVSAAKICFGAEFGGVGPRQNEYVWVTSVDGSVIDGLTATIVYDAGQPTGWLTAPLDATTAPARLRLLPAVGTLPVGTYTATVQVASPKAGNSPVSVRVTLTIKELTPAQQSLLNVHVEWEGPQNGGLATLILYGGGGGYCGSSCTGYLPSGVGDIQVSYDQDYGARFLRWTGACTGEGAGAECTVHFSTPGTTQEVTAVFGTMASTISNIKLQGAGASGTVAFSSPVTAPGGGPLTCRLVNGVQAGRCEGVIEAGVGTFTVTATPDPGSLFVWWVAGGLPGLRESPIQCAETIPSCTFTFATGGGSFDGVVTFASASSMLLEIAIEGSGSVNWPYLGDRYTQICPTSCKEYFEAGSTVRLTAYPGEGATFLGWTGCSAPSGSTCDMAMTENRHVVARFGP